MVFLLIFILIQDFHLYRETACIQSKLYIRFILYHKPYLFEIEQAEAPGYDFRRLCQLFDSILHLGDHRFKTLHILHIGNPFHRRSHTEGHEGDEENHNEDIRGQSNEERFSRAEPIILSNGRHIQVERPDSDSKASYAGESTHTRFG